MKIERQESWRLDDLFPETKGDPTTQAILNFKGACWLRAAWGADALWVGHKKHLWKINPNDLKVLQRANVLENLKSVNEVGFEVIGSFTCCQDVLWIIGETSPLRITDRYSKLLSKCGQGGAWVGIGNDLHEISRADAEGRLTSR